MVCHHISISNCNGTWPPPIKGGRRHQGVSPFLWNPKIHGNPENQRRSTAGNTVTPAAGRSNQRICGNK